MNIKILGTGCPNCQKLESNVKQALEKLKIVADVEKVSEIQDIVSYGIMSTPALVVDGMVLAAGMVLDIEQIAEALIKCKISSENPGGTCSCCGSC